MLCNVFRRFASYCGPDSVPRIELERSGMHAEDCSILRVLMSKSIQGLQHQTGTRTRRIALLLYQRLPNRMDSVADMPDNGTHGQFTIVPQPSANDHPNPRPSRALRPPLPCPDESTTGWLPAGFLRRRSESCQRSLQD